MILLTHSAISNLTKAMLASTCILLSSCAHMSASEATRNAITVPDMVVASNQTTNLSIEQLLQKRWWTLFNDAQLTTLIDRALLQNRDLAKAAIRVRQAYLNADLARSDQFPSLSASTSGSYNKSLDSGDSSRNYGARLATGYQLDLFGKLSAQHDAAVWTAQASEADRQSAALTLISTLAQIYWQIGYLNDRISNAEHNLMNAQKLDQIIQVQYNAGAVSGSEVAQSAQNLSGQKITLSQLKQQLSASQNALSLLFDEPVLPVDATIHYPMQLPREAPPAIASHIPASILANRPDIAAAEFRLRKILADHQSQKASFYPNITLTGALGTSSTTLADILKNPVLALGASISLPFIEWRKMKRQITISQLDYDYAVIEFRDQLYHAFSDVYNVLTAHAQLQEQLELQRQQLSAANTNERLAQIRYQAGAISLQIWLDAQNSVRNARNQLSQTQLDLLGSVMQFYTSTAGGETLIAP